MSVDIVDIFCEIDDFCKGFEKEWMKQLLSGGRCCVCQVQQKGDQVFPIEYGS